jgi:hypothetical protein
MRDNISAATTYAGINFPSRLEAQYAAFFDLVDWQWEHAPLDLKDYLPTFRVKIPCNQHDSKCGGRHTVLVEITPHRDIDKITDAPKYRLAKNGYRPGPDCDAVVLFGDQPSVSYWLTTEGEAGGESMISFWVKDWTIHWKEAGNKVRLRVQ